MRSRAGAELVESDLAWTMVSMIRAGKAAASSSHTARRSAMGVETVSTPMQRGVAHDERVDRRLEAAPPVSPLAATAAP